MDYAKESLRLHKEWKGKIQVVTNVPVETQDDLSLAYTPGVAQPCLFAILIDTTSKSFINLEQQVSIPQVPRPPMIFDLLRGPI